jgi:hypothetical protein
VCLNNKLGLEFIIRIGNRVVVFETKGRETGGYIF